MIDFNFFSKLKWKLFSILKKINKRIYDTIPNAFISFKCYWFMMTMMGDVDYNGKIFRDDLSESLLDYLPDAEKQNNQLVRHLTKDSIKCYLLYGITPDEYYLHDFRHCDETYRQTILSRKHKDEITIRSLGPNWHTFFYQLKDKWSFYQLAQPFFKRDVCKAESETDYKYFEEFCLRHPVFIAKPRLSSCGIGVHKVDMSHCKWGGVRGIFDYYLQLDNGKWMFEELIEQSPEMAAWHPSSVNTIRIPSIMTKDGPVVILPLFRTGKNGNVVDNCHNDGGLMSVPDKKTGIIVCDGYDIYTNIVEKHPNTGLRFKGWQVPKWQELIETAAELHRHLPLQHKYIGFDFALTSKGWVVVEGNWGNFPHQVCVHHGIREEFEQLMKS